MNILNSWYALLPIGKSIKPTCPGGGEGYQPGLPFFWGDGPVAAGVLGHSGVPLPDLILRIEIGQGGIPQGHWAAFACGCL